MKNQNIIHVRSNPGFKISRLHRLLINFTLLELLIVIAIISILAALLLPTLNSVKGKAKAIACISNMAQCGKVLTFYANDFDGYVFMKTSATTYQWALNYLSANLGNGTYTPLQNYGELAIAICPARLPYSLSNCTANVPTGMDIRNFAYTHTYAFVNISSWAPILAPVTVTGQKIFRLDQVKRADSVRNNCATPILAEGMTTNPSDNAVHKQYQYCNMEPDSSSSYYPCDPRHPRKTTNLLFPDGHVVSAGIRELYPVYLIRPCYDEASGQTVPTPR